MIKNDYKTILVIGTGFILLYFIFKIDWLLYIALSVVCLSAISEKITQLISRAWFSIAKVLGWINSRILLSIIYIFLLLPMAFIKRTFGRQSVNLNRKEGSYFVQRNHAFSKSDLENPW